MRKETLLDRKIVLKLATFLFVGFLFLGLSPKAHAGVCDEQPPKFRFDIMIACKLKEINPLVSIQRTINDAATTILTNVLASIVFNSNPDDLGTCGVAMLADRIDTLPGVNMTDITDQNGVLFSAAEVQDARDAAPAIGCDFNDTLFGSRANGSLMGVTKFAFNTVTTEQPPINLAYYFKHNLQKVPIISDTAYAQTVSYNAWGLEFAIQIWEKSRNIAYAMMSVIMLVIGILIITRKKINPQTVVSVQTALPRIVISLILITFSYPIGAILISIGYALVVVVIRLFFGTIIDDVSQLADMDVLVMMVTIMAATIGPQGVIGVVTAMLMAVLTIIALLVAIIKIIIINLKVLIAIIFAPIQFAIAAIPGQEDLVQDWFKKMLAKVLAIPAIFFMIALAWYMLIVPFTNPDFFTSILVQSTDPISIGYTLIRGARAVGSRMITIMLLPLMTIMTMFFALKADKVVEEFIMGGRGKPKRR